VARLYLSNNLGYDMQSGRVPFQRFIDAARSGRHADLAIVQRYIQENLNDVAKINATNQFGYTALMWAAKNNNLAILNALLAVQGIDVNAANQDGDTALTLVAYEGHDAIFDALLTVAGINFNVAGEFGNTPLIWAACKGRKGRAHMFDTLLSMKGINLDAVGQYQYTALIWAASKLNIPFYEKLIAKGADVTKRNRDGNSAAQVLQIALDEQKANEAKEAEKASKKTDVTKSNDADDTAAQVFQIDQKANEVKKALKNRPLARNNSIFNNYNEAQQKQPVKLKVIEDRNFEIRRKLKALAEKVSNAPAEIFPDAIYLDELTKYERALNTLDFDKNLGTAIDNIRNTPKALTANFYSLIVEQTELFNEKVHQDSLAKYIIAQALNFPIPLTGEYKIIQGKIPSQEINYLVNILKNIFTPIEVQRQELNQGIIALADESNVSTEEIKKYIRVTSNDSGVKLLTDINHIRLPYDKITRLITMFSAIYQDRTEYQRKENLQKVQMEDLIFGVGDLHEKINSIHASIKMKIS